MLATHPLRSPGPLRHCATHARLALLAASFTLAAASPALATPLNFALFNPSGSLQSRLNLTATGTLAGTNLVSNPQLAAGGLNGQGSESTTYNVTNSDGSNMLANVTQHGVTFPGGGTAVANNATGLFGNLQIKPGAGGATGTGPANYGVDLSSPQDVQIPALDISSLNIPGITTLNPGTLKSVDVNIALRNTVLDIQSGALPLNPTGTYPQTFNSTQLNVSVAGTADILLSGFLVPANLGDFVTLGAALLGLKTALAAQNVTLTVATQFFPTQGYNVGFAFSTPLPTNATANTDGSNGTIEHIGSNLRLTVPINFDIVPTTLPAPLNTLLTADLGFSGKLIGQTPFVAVDVPEPSSIALSAMGLVGLAAFARRRGGNRRGNR